MRADREAYELFEDLTCAIRSQSALLVSRSGESLSLVDACAYWILGQLDKWTQGRAKPVGWLSRVAARVKATADRRWFTRVLPPRGGNPRWIHVVRAKRASWKGQFAPILNRVRESQPDVGVVVIEEVRKGAAPALEDLARAETIDVAGSWKPTAAALPRGAAFEPFSFPRELLQMLRLGLDVNAIFLCRWLDYLSAAFRHWPPSLLLLSNDLESIRRAAAILYQQRGVPVVNVQHGMINDSSVYRLGISDRHLLWGQAFVDTLRGLGIDQKKLVAVGAPHFDGRAPNKAAANAHKGDGSRHRTTQECHWVLHAAQPPSFEIPEHTCRELIVAHSQLAKDNPDIEVTIRFHPREIAAIRALASAKAAEIDNIRICDAPDIAAALERCDVGSTVFSTASMDAAVARKPTLLLDFAGIGHRFPFPCNPPWYSVQAEQDLAPRVRNAAKWAASLDDEKWQRFDRRYLHGLDSHAAERAAAQLLHTMAPSCRP